MTALTAGLLIAVAMVIVPARQAEAINCMLVRVYWSTYAPGSPEGCEGAANNCQVFEYDCE